MYQMKGPTSTNFANSKKRVIMMGPKGGTFVKTTKGKSYSPVAKFVKTPAGTMRKLKSTNKVPKGVKVAKTVRRVRKNKGQPRKLYKTRKNKGVKRGPRFSAQKSFNSLFA